MMFAFSRYMLFLIFVLLVITSCNNKRGVDASDMLPVMSTFEKVVVDDFSKTLEMMGLLHLVRSQPALGAKIVAVDTIISCLRKSGMADFALYQEIGEPLSVGLALVINESRIVDFVSCLPGSTLFSDFQFDPCYNSWRYADPEATYYMLYLGSTAQFCQAACNAMSGCTAS